MITDYYSDPYVKTMIENMPEKTGKSLQAWFSLLRQKELNQHGQIMNLLKNEHGVTHGYANTIALLYRQDLSGGPDSEEKLIADQYGRKADLKPLFDQLIKHAQSFGKDIEIVPKKSYVSLRRSKQFAIIQPSTKSRMDLGLNLDPNLRGSGILIQGDRWSGMCSHRIELHHLDEITPEVIQWMQKAYDRAA